MYTAYWNLKKKPFEIGNDPKFYFPSQSHQAVLLKLRYLLENRRGNGLLLGEAGSGKSLLVAMLADLRRKGASIGPFLEINMPQFSAADLLFYLAEKLESLPSPGPKPSDDYLSFPTDELPPVYKAFSAIERILTRLAKEKQKPVLFLDGAERIRDEEVWSVMKSLIGLEHRGGPLISLLIVAPESKLARPIPFIEEYLEAVAEIQPLSVEETAGYVNHRLEIAGSKRSDLFTDRAMEAIHHFTEGNPRKINRLCDLALLVGFAEQVTQIDDEMIVNLNNELIPS